MHKNKFAALAASFVALLFGLSVTTGAQASLLKTILQGNSSTGTSTPVTGTIDPVNGFLTTSGPVSYRYLLINGTYVATPVGTTAYSANLTVNGQSRRYLVMRPDPAPASAPALLLLHPHGSSPEQMVNLSVVAPYVLTQNFWAVMPAAQGADPKWKDDPKTDSADDVDFISALIDSLAGQGVDTTRISVAGYSSGGFMSERLACELSGKIASFGMDVATIRNDLSPTCKPAVQRPKQYFLGTNDKIVPYDGMLGLYSALNTMAFWAQQQGCGGVVATPLPDIANDGTTVQRTDYTGCTAGQVLKLYTVYGGAHTWPGGQTQSFGTTTMDISATGLIWLFATAYHR